VIEDILKYARKSKERAVDEGDTSVTELKAQVAHQEKLIRQLLAKSSSEEPTLSPPTLSRPLNATESTPIALGQGTSRPLTPCNLTLLHRLSVEKGLRVSFIR
jgi:hypothetical protein